MTFKSLRSSLLLLPVLFLIMFFRTPGVASAPAFAPPLPNPILYLTGVEYFQSAGKQFIRYQYDVLNKTDYPAAMFAAAPALPPCGANKNASRSWVDIFDQRGKRLNSFCDLSKPASLNGIWFALEPNAVPPSYIYIEINDRQTNTIYKSNLADTTL
jgi:hypothetical protein